MSRNRFLWLMSVLVVSCLLIGCQSTTKPPAPIVDLPKLAPIAPSLKQPCRDFQTLPDGPIGPREALQIIVKNFEIGHECAQAHAALIDAVKDRGL